MTIIISVVICTYNRSDMLKGCIKSLICQTAPKESFEIIVIDNNSSDTTKQTCQEFLENINFNYIVEKNIGLSHARNRGIAEATGDYIAFIDDDCLVPDHWIEEAIRIIRNYQNLDGFGGPLYPFYTTSKPSWFEDIYGVQMGGRSEQYFLQPGQSFIGANMVWNRELVKIIGGFRTDLGYVGKSEYLGEDTEAFIRTWHKKANAKFLFSPSMLLYHWLPAEKIKLIYRVKRNFNIGVFLYKINIPTVSQTKISYFKKSINDLLKGFIKAILAIPKYKQWQKWVYCEYSPLMINVGKIYGILTLQSSTKSLNRE